MIDAKYNLGPVGHVYAQYFLRFFTVWCFDRYPVAVILSAFSGTFPNTDGLLVKVFVDRYHLELQGSQQRVLFLEE